MCVCVGVRGRGEGRGWVVLCVQFLRYAHAGKNCGFSAFYRIIFVVWNYFCSVELLCYDSVFTCHVLISAHFLLCHK